MATLLVEPFGGMAGDMFLAALLDLEEQRFRLEHLQAMADAMLPGGIQLRHVSVQRRSLRGLLLEVRALEETPPHRNLADMLGLVERSGLEGTARARAEAGFRSLAQAEARVHGVAVDEVHFHEVGGVDTALDLCGAALGLDLLGIERVISTPPLVGDGTVRCAHGEMPVPAPGTAELILGMPHVRGGGGERLTPTGAVLLQTLVHSFDPPDRFVACAVGYGAGSRDPDSGPPNLMRVQFEADDSVPPGDGSQEVEGEPVLLGEWNLDDATGEEIALQVQILLKAGALDAWATPVHMKKGRPGAVVGCLFRPDMRAAIEHVAFDHSPTLGVRVRHHGRTECARESITVEMEGAKVRVKRRVRPHAPGIPGPFDLSPEFEDLAILVGETGRPLRDLEQEAILLARRSLRGGDGG